MADGEVLERAVKAIANDEVVVYPTETVYGLGASAVSSSAIEQVFTIKGRARTNPLSVAISDLEAVDSVARPSARARAFMETFFPGPVTVVCERNPSLPAELTAGRDRVGVRIPDHELARRLLDQTFPLTATSANRSGAPAVQSVSELHPSIRDAVSVVLDGGRTQGAPSTVVDVDEHTIHRAGALADEVETWLAEH